MLEMVGSGQPKPKSEETPQARARVILAEGLTNQDAALKAQAQAAGVEIRFNQSVPVDRPVPPGRALIRATGPRRSPRRAGAPRCRRPRTPRAG